MNNHHSSCCQSVPNWHKEKEITISKPVNITSDDAAFTPVFGSKLMTGKPSTICSFGRENKPGKLAKPRYKFPSSLLQMLVEYKAKFFQRFFELFITDVFVWCA